MRVEIESERSYRKKGDIDPPIDHTHNSSLLLVFGVTSERLFTARYEAACKVGGIARLSWNRLNNQRVPLVRSEISAGSPNLAHKVKSASQWRVLVRGACTSIQIQGVTDVHSKRTQRAKWVTHGSGLRRRSSDHWRTSHEGGV